MAKQVVRVIKLQIPAGKATPQPPVGTVLGPAGINIMEFCTKYNEETKDRMGDIVPVEITLYEDRSYSFKLKTSPTVSLIKKLSGVKTGASKGKTIVGSISKDQVRQIAEMKMPDLNAYDIESAMKIVAGTAKSMGIEVK